MVTLKKLRELAEAGRLFGVCDKHREGDEGYGFATVYAEQDHQNYDLMTIDTAQYEAENFAMPLAAFYAAAGPKAILDLLDMLEAAQKDAERYRFLKSRMLGVDFDWNDHGITALSFEMPDGRAYGGDCDQNIDAAMDATKD